MLKGVKSWYDGQGFTKPLPFLLWCAFSLTSDGCAETVWGEETTAERAAEVMLERLEESTRVVWKARLCGTRAMLEAAIRTGINRGA